jgi:uncharacterized protein (TIGR03435 family)
MVGRLVLAMAGVAFAAGPEFEVASVKPSDPGSEGGTIAPGGATFRASNIPLTGLLTFAYDVRLDQLDGAPGWAMSQRYDIVAKVGDPGTDPRTLLSRQRQMLQNLLADRFQLRIRIESRERPIYALAVDGNGPKMRENNDMTSHPFPLIRLTGRGQAVAQIVPMSYLVQFLANQAGRIVLDQTKLKGSYDFTLNWAPDPAFAPGRDGASPAEDSGGPSLFTALREQLGLRLESTRGPVDFIVVEHIEKPSAN